MILAIGLVTVNFAVKSETILIYPTTICLNSLIFSFLGAGLASGVGVLISLRAPTVRHAHQVLTAAGMLLLLVPVIGVMALPDDLIKRFTYIGSINAKIFVMIILSLLNIVFLIAATIKFKRTRLLLD